MLIDTQFVCNLELLVQEYTVIAIIRALLLEAIFGQCTLISAVHVNGQIIQRATFVAKTHLHANLRANSGRPLPRGAHVRTTRSAIGLEFVSCARSTLIAITI